MLDGPALMAQDQVGGVPRAQFVRDRWRRRHPFDYSGGVYAGQLIGHGFVWLAVDHHCHFTMMDADVLSGTNMGTSTQVSNP